MADPEIFIVSRLNDCFGLDLTLVDFDEKAPLELLQLLLDVLADLDPRLRGDVRDAGTAESAGRAADLLRLLKYPPLRDRADADGYQKWVDAAAAGATTTVHPALHWLLGDVERLSVRDVRTISLLNAGQALIFSSGLGTMLTMCARRVLGLGGAAGLHSFTIGDVVAIHAMMLQLRRMLVAWLLAHTDTIHVAAASTAEELPLALELLWRAADALSREMASWNLAQALKCAELFLATTPLATPPGPTLPAPLA